MARLADYVGPFFAQLNTVRQQSILFVSNNTRPLFVASSVGLMFTLGAVSLPVLTISLSAIAAGTVAERKYQLFTRTFEWLKLQANQLKPLLAKFYKIKEDHQNDEDGWLDDVIEQALKDVQNQTNGKVMPGTDVMADRIASVLSKVTQTIELANPNAAVAAKLVEKASNVIEAKVLEKDKKVQEDAIKEFIEDGKSVVTDSFVSNSASNEAKVAAQSLISGAGDLIAAKVDGQETKAALEAVVNSVEAAAAKALGTSSVGISAEVKARLEQAVLAGLQGESNEDRLSELTESVVAKVTHDVQEKLESQAAKLLESSSNGAIDGELSKVIIDALEENLKAKSKAVDPNIQLPSSDSAMPLRFSSSNDKQKADLVLETLFKMPASSSTMKPM